MNQAHPTRSRQDSKVFDAKIFLVISCLCVGFWFFSNPVSADQQGGQRPAGYLENGVGGMQEAMAGAAVGVRDDVASGFWNPAGLTGLAGWQVEDQYTLLSQGQVLNYFGIANQYRQKFFYGLSGIIYSAGGDLEARSGPTLNPDSLFDDFELTFLGSFAFRLSPQYSFGFNVKVFSQSLSNFSGFGVGEDLGMQFRVDKDTTFGFLVGDPYSVINYSNNTSTIFPLTLKAGIASRQEKWNTKTNFDLEWSSDLGLRPRLGVEWRPLESLALRAGSWAGNLTAGAGGGAAVVYFTGGFGLHMPVGGDEMEFDYVLLQDRIDPGAVLHQVSLVGRFL